MSRSASSDLDLGEESSSITSPPPSPPPERRQRPFPLTGDLLVTDGKFGFTWFVGNGGLDDKVKRARSKRQIMAFNSLEMWAELGKYMPRSQFYDPLAIYTLHKVQVIFTGILRLSICQVQQHIRDVQQICAQLKKGRTCTVFVQPDPVTGQLEMREPEPEVEKSPRLPNMVPAKRPTKKPPKAVDPPATATTGAETQEAMSAPEAPAPRPRRPRRPKPESLPSDAEILRMLVTKASELPGADANLLHDPDLPDPAPGVENASFYDGTDMDPNQQLEDQHAYNRSFSVETEPNPPTAGGAFGGANDLAEAAHAREISVRTPVPNPNVVVTQPVAPRPQARAAEPQPDSFPVLDAVQPLVPPRSATPRRRSRRRLNFFDEQTQIPRRELRSNVRQKVEMDELLLQASDNFGMKRKPPVNWNDFITDSGRSLLGSQLRVMRDDIRTRLPLPDPPPQPSPPSSPPAPPSPPAEVLRPNSSVGASTTGVVGNSLVAQNATAASSSNLEATGVVGNRTPHTPSISAVEVPDDGPIGGGSPVQGGAAVEFAIVPSPGASPNAPFDVAEDAPVEMEEGPPEAPPPPAPPAERLLTFRELVPVTEKRKTASRIFFGLLKHQALKNVELIQDEPFGEIKIRILNANFNPSQYVESDLRENGGA